MAENKKLNQDGTAAKKRRVRFNFIDVLILLAFMLVAAIIINMFVPLSILDRFNNSNEQQIQYTVELVAVEEDFIYNIAENNAVIDSVSKHELGNVINVDNNTHYSELKYNENEASGWLSPYPDKYNMLVTITVTAKYKEGEGYSVGDRRIAVGEKLYLRFPNFTAEGYCVGVSRT